MRPSDDEVQQLIRCYDRKRTARRNWDTQWERLAMYIQPGKADFITDRSPGDPERNNFMFDSTAAVANHTLASHMHSAMTNPANQWAELQYRDRDMRDDDPAMEWLQECTRTMFDAINDSNFVSVINETYQNLCCFGTACLETTYTEDAAEGFKLVFRYIPLHKLVFQENVHSRIDTVYYEHKYTSEQLKRLFPDLDDSAITQAEKDKEFSVIRCVRPNPDHDPEKDMSEEHRAFQGLWIHNRELIHTEYHRELPFHIPRWSKMDTEPYGYGPGLMCYPEIRSLNEAKRLELAAWEKAIDSTMFMNTGNVVGDLDRSAGGVTYVRDIRGIMFPGAATDWNATQIKAEEIRRSIQATYLIDQLVLPERPNATATEVQIRYSMMQRVLGPTAGRLEAELLNPMVNRIFSLMLYNEQFEEMPPDLENAKVDVQYTGPLARAQTSDESTATERMLGIAANLLPIYPEALDGVDVPAALKLMAEQWGVPAKVLRSDDELAQIQRERAEQQQAQQQMVQQQQLNEAAESSATATLKTAQAQAVR